MRNAQDLADDLANSQEFTARSGVKHYARGYNQWLHRPLRLRKTSDGQLLSVDAAGNPEDAFTDTDKTTLAKYGVPYFTDRVVAANTLPVREYGSLLSIITGEDEEVMVAWQRIYDMRLAYLAKAIMATPEEFDGIWDEYMAEIKNAGLDLVTESFNKNLSDRLVDWGVK